MDASLDFDPVAERLLTEGRTRRQHRLKGREHITRLLFAAVFLVAAAMLALEAPSQRSASPLLAALLIGGFALASRIEFEVGSGSTVPTELFLVPMLFLLPAGIIPLAVALGLVLGQLPEFVRGTFPPGRILVVIGNAWYSLGPALVLIAAGQPGPRLGAWWLLVLALLAQAGSDFGSSVAREWFALANPRKAARPAAALGFMVDALLAPIGLAVAVATPRARQRRCCRSRCWA